nr:biotin-dependent carboxyltransferase family protein [Mycolicibacterium smegmatis]
MIEVLRTGMLATIQDGGRPGYAHLGVPRSGAADIRSLHLANRLVGNDETAATIEITLGNAAFLFHRAAVVALVGAPVPTRVSGTAVATDRILYIRQGEVLELAVPCCGLRTYLAVAGGLRAPLTLGSASTDTLSGLGPPPLQVGQQLDVGLRHRPAPVWPDCVPTPVPYRHDVHVRYRRGPRDDWFSDETLAQFDSARWTLTAESNRVGARLSGPVMAVARQDPLPSEGMVLGSIEIPPAGQPIIFLADHPTTGGYPVIGVVDEYDVAVLAQTRPGSSIRFSRAMTTRSGQG